MPAVNNADAPAAKPSASGEILGPEGALERAKAAASTRETESVKDSAPMKRLRKADGGRSAKRSATTAELEDDMEDGAKPPVNTLTGSLPGARLDALAPAKSCHTQFPNRSRRGSQWTHVTSQAMRAVDCFMSCDRRQCAVAQVIHAFSHSLAGSPVQPPPQASAVAAVDLTTSEQKSAGKQAATPKPARKPAAKAGAIPKKRKTSPRPAADCESAASDSSYGDARSAALDDGGSSPRRKAAKPTKKAVLKYADAKAKAKVSD